MNKTEKGSTKFLRCARTALAAVSGLMAVTVAGAIPLAAQIPPSPRVIPIREFEPSVFDLGPSVTFHFPEDVNVRPQCIKLDLPCTSPRTFPDAGLGLQGAAYVNHRLAVAGEFNYYVNYWSSSTQVTPRKNYVKSFGVGPRVVTHWHHLGSTDKLGFHAFAQLLAGIESSMEVPTRFALQPGAGADFKLRYPGLWIRVGADYRWTNGEGRNLSGTRLQLGVVTAM